jgi:hypothetical protein
MSMRILAEVCDQIPCFMVGFVPWVVSLTADRLTPEPSSWMSISETSMCSIRLVLTILRLALTGDRFTHVYVFNIGMPDDLIEHLIRIFVESASVKSAALPTLSALSCCRQIRNSLSPPVDVGQAH